MKKRTKIIATISPKTGTPEFLSQLFAAGVNVIRINTAHQDIDESKILINNIRKTNSAAAILVDTKGPEVRTSSFGVPIQANKGDTIFIRGDKNGICEGNTVYVNYERFVNEVPVNSRILIDDGDIELMVTDKNDDTLICEVKNTGEIKLRKGVNVPGVKLSLPVISDKDRAFIEFAIESELDFIAHSFVQHPSDILEIKALLAEKKSLIKVIAKIENQTGVDNIDAIIEVSDGIMVARGDLGIEIPIERIPVTQREIVRKCVRMNKPVIIATQMLHTMITNPRPTRAEVTDVATAVHEKADALMLSGETAMGAYPIEAVCLMSRVIQESEKLLDTYILKPRVAENSVLSVLSQATVSACEILPIKAIIVDTLTGRTANYIAAYRGKIPVYAFCYSEIVRRQMSLTFGVKAYVMNKKDSRDTFLTETLEILISENKVTLVDTVAVIGGSFGPTNGANFITIATVENLAYYNRVKK
jgi:pyruvate kinase